MKIALCALNAKHSHSCLALYSLREAAKSPGRDIIVKEYTINQDTGFVLRDIFSLKPDVCCFSVSIWNVTQTLSIIDRLKIVLPSCVIICGGPEASFESKSLFSSKLDAVVKGEGEAVFKMALGAIEKGVGFSETPGMIYRDGADLLETEDPLPLDMATLPFPYRNGLDEFNGRILYYESSRGCPFSCAYCLSANDPLRVLPLDRVFGELDFFLDGKPRLVKFVDRTFNCSKARSTAIWERLIANDNGFTSFHFEIGGDLLGQRELDLLKRARKGLFQFEVGVQSSSPDTLARTSRSSNLARLSENVRILKTFGNINLHLDLIAGLPGETLEKSEQSLNFVASLAPDQLQLGFLKLLKGSELRRNAKALGIAYANDPPYEVLETPDLSFADLAKLKSIEEAIEIYYNSGLFTQTMRYALSVFDTAAELFKSLADFGASYGEGYRSKRQRYEMLFNFLSNQESKRTLLDLLRYDLLFRENERNPPEWLSPRPSKEELKQRSNYLDSLSKHGYPLAQTPEEKAAQSSRRKELAAATSFANFHTDMPLWLSTGKLEARECVLMFRYGEQTDSSEVCLWGDTLETAR
ncbi:MAG: DUF4080 domain-containing protein [Clostridiales bacterium]|nr:DUF4080 domain-containing protein [Clostridiales bacterium]